MSKAHEFIDFWVENSVHAVEQYRAAGASQDVTELTRRCIEAAEDQGISESDMKAEIGDVADYIGPGSRRLIRPRVTDAGPK